MIYESSVVTRCFQAIRCSNAENCSEESEVKPKNVMGPSTGYIYDRMPRH